MSEHDNFLLVTGEGWTELLNASAFINTHIDINQLQQMLAGQEWSNISAVLDAQGYIPENSTITDARLFNTNDPDEQYRFWYKI